MEWGSGGGGGKWEGGWGNQKILREKTAGVKRRGVITGREITVA